jgi:threonine/homoserine/homoserine lactone efflux protein
MIVYLIWGAAYGFAAGVQPGPFQAYLIAEAARSGARRALPLVLAPLMSDGPIIAAVLLVLSRLPSWWIQALRFAGGAFVLYLAAGAFRAARIPDPGAGDPGGPHRGVLRAALVNLLNPGPYVFWSLVTGPVLLTGWKEKPVNGVAMLTGFYGTMVAVSAGLLLVCAGAGRLGPGVNRGLRILAATGLLGFGIYQIWTGVQAGWRVQ